MFQYRNIFPAQGRGSIISQTSLRSYARVWCRKCGCMLSKSYLFCPKCGNKISQVGTTSRVISWAATTTSTSASSAPFLATISNLETFRERKEPERRSSRVRNKSGSKTQRIQDSEVCITVGLMKNRKTFMRGEWLPVKLMSSATARDILEAAKKKHAAYKRFRWGNTVWFTKIVRVPGMTSTSEPVPGMTSSRNDINIRTILVNQTVFSYTKSLIVCCVFLLCSYVIHSVADLRRWCSQVKCCHRRQSSVCLRSWTQLNFAGKPAVNAWDRLCIGDKCSHMPQRCPR